MIKLIPTLTLACCVTAYAAGGLTVTQTTPNWVSGTGATNTSTTVTQGGSPTTVSLNSTYVAPAYTQYSNFTTMTFDPGTWTSTGGTFNPAVQAAGGWYVSANDVTAYTGSVKIALETAVKNEVAYIQGLVSTANIGIANYNATATISSSSDTTLDSTLNALKTEVSTTKSVVDSIRAMKFDLPSGTNISLGGQSLTTYSSSLSSIIQTTGGTSTVASDGGITFK